eukprot:620722-Pelagomonas_calceolata.AAC.2
MAPCRIENDTAETLLVHQVRVLGVHGVACKTCCCSVPVTSCAPPSFSAHPVLHASNVHVAQAVCSCESQCPFLNAHNLTASIDFSLYIFSVATVCYGHISCSQGLLSDLLSCASCGSPAGGLLRSRRSAPILPHALCMGRAPGTAPAAHGAAARGTAVAGGVATG